MTKHNFERLQKSSQSMGEANDCTVKALAVVCRVGYQMAHKALADQGRKPRKGCYPHQQIAAIEALGFKVAKSEGGYTSDYRRYMSNAMPRQHNGSRYTASTIGKLCAKGYWLAWTKGHVLAVHNGKVIDWTEGRKHQIQHIVKIVKA